jgi:cobalt-zinc-cadmium resistance protein CzcA
MLNTIIEFSLRQRALVLLATGVLIFAGLWSAWRLPIDAVPDITNIQVRVNTEVPTLAPEEIERLVTFPIEHAMAGLPGLLEMRSLSKFGLSQVSLTFDDRTDVYLARQLVSERLSIALPELPEGLSPQLAPISTGLGDIFFYVVGYSRAATNRPPDEFAQLLELSMIQESIIKPMLRNTPGVAEVNTSGGYEKQIVIEPDPKKLWEAGLGFEDIADIIQMNAENVGGGFVEIGREQVIIRSNTRVRDASEIGMLPIRLGARAQPLLISDVAHVTIGHSFRTGASTENGEEAVLGGAMMLSGENSRMVARAVKARLQTIQEKLPPGIEIRDVYDRAILVNQTIKTVENNLFHGAVLVAFILLLLLGNIRAALIVSLAIPLSFLFAMSGMVACRLTGNLMSLGAIDFGLIIDGAVVMVENIVRRLGERQHQLGRRLDPHERIATVSASAREVASPMFFGVLIITVVYVPILTLTGIEGKMFKPMAITVILCLVGALVLALTLMPVLCSFLLRGWIAEKDNMIITAVKAIYTPLLNLALRLRWLVVGLAILMFAGSMVIFSRLGAEFIPQLDEGSLSIQLIRSNSVGLDASLQLQKKSERVLLAQFPEITHLFSRIGTAEIATDPMGPNVADTYVMLAPREQWRKRDGRTISKEELIDAMREALNQEAPGQALLFTQPIQLRFNEIMAGARADLVLKLYGDDFRQLEALALTARDLLVGIAPESDIEFEAMGRQPMIEVVPRREAMSRYGIHGDEINQLVSHALGGEVAGMMMDGNRRYDVVVRLHDSLRTRHRDYEFLPVRLHDGGLVRLGELAEIKVVDELGTINRESNQRRVSVLINLRGRDTERFVREAEDVLARELAMPDGYYLEFGGQFENLIKARQRLSIVVPATLVLIFVLLFLSFQSLRQAGLVFVSVPLAITGGVLALWVRDMPFTISAGVGFIALSGIAVLNGIMLISFINQLRGQGLAVRQAVLDGTLTRLRPKLMTALTTAIGFVPMAIAVGPGAEVQRPLATVVIGGVLTSTFLTLIILPILYDWMETLVQKRQKTTT